MSNLSVFNFDQTSVRIISDENPLFVASDVANALGYKRANDAVTQHCKGTAKHRILKTSGGKQKLRVIYEPDVYRLIFGSKLKSAQKFQDWVFEEVLPSIRKTGKYETPQEDPVLTDDQAGHIYQTVMNMVKNNRGTYQGLFSSLKREFGRGSYKLIKQKDYKRACRLLNVEPKTDFDDGMTTVPHAYLINLIREIRAYQSALMVVDTVNQEANKQINELKNFTGYHFGDEVKKLN